MGDPNPLGGQGSIPVIDLAPFVHKHSENKLMSSRRVVQQIAEACMEWGFFQVINHGVNPVLLKRAAANAKEFFHLPMHEKLKLSTEHPPVGFVHQVVEGKQHLFVSATENPASKLNVWPEIPANFRTATEELIHDLHELSRLLVSLISESLGLPGDHLNNLCHGTSDILLTNFYPASPPEYKAPVFKQHKDGDILTLVAQLNESDGLQVLKDEDNWITVKPMEGSLIVNVGDVLQVWTNDKYKSVLHRVASNTKDRYSSAYFHQAGNDTLVQPLPEFTVDADEPPRYRPFLLGEYSEMRMEDGLSDSKNAKKITIEHYAI